MRFCQVSDGLAEVNVLGETYRLPNPNVSHLFLALPFPSQLTPLSQVALVRLRKGIIGIAGPDLTVVRAGEVGT
jgi:hypothetical protein